MDNQIQQAVKLISKAQNVVALTGAGISTPSGIPDFRSPGSGMWEKADPMQVASIFGFRRDPEQFYRWIHPSTDLMLSANPNPAHKALAELEQLGKLKAVVTQNIDNLHQKAGSQRVYELHGHLREFTCLQCQQIEAAEGIIDKFITDGQVPQHHCGGILKPNVILFGEQLPVSEFIAAQLAFEEADLIIVAGSSLETAPASDLPLIALNKGAQAIVVNFQPTYLDPRAEVVINDDVAEILPRIVALVSS